VEEVEGAARGGRKDGRPPTPDRCQPPQGQGAERDGEHQAAGASRDGAAGLDLPSHRGKKHGR
jgi:hypothetical protein